MRKRGLGAYLPRGGVSREKERMERKDRGGRKYGGGGGPNDNLARQGKREFLQGEIEREVMLIQDEWKGSEMACNLSRKNGQSYPRKNKNRASWS